MKKIFLILSLICITMFVGCSNPANSVTPTMPTVTSSDYVGTVNGSGFGISITGVNRGNDPYITATYVYNRISTEITLYYFNDQGYQGYYKTVRYTPEIKINVDSGTINNYCPKSAATLPITFNGVDTTLNIQ